MTRQELIKGISVAVQESAVKTVISELSAGVNQSADWYNALSAQDRERVAEVVRLSVNVALFGMFCVLDNVRAVEYGPDKGTLRLIYVNAKRGVEVQLNGSGGDELHDIFHDYMD